MAEKTEDVVKYGHLINAWQGLHRLAETLTGPKGTQLAVALKKAAPWYQAWEEARQQIILQIGGGKQQLEQGTEEFARAQVQLQQKFHEVQDLEIPVTDFDPPAITTEETEQLDISASLLTQLDPIFHWLPEPETEMEMIRQHMNGKQAEA